MLNQLSYNSLVPATGSLESGRGSLSCVETIGCTAFGAIFLIPIVSQIN